MNRKCILNNLKESYTSPKIPFKYRTIKQGRAMPNVFLINIIICQKSIKRKESHDKFIYFRNIHPCNRYIEILS